MLNKILSKFGFALRRIDTPMRSLERGLVVLSAFVKPNTVIDIGVADGTPELYKAFPAHSCDYILVEADPHYEGRLKQLAQALGAIVEPVFCGAEKGTASLTLYADHRKSSTLKSRRRGAGKEISVKVDTLDDIVARNPVEGPYLVKIDVEGADLDVLKGARNTLRHSCAVVVETSVNPRYEGEVDPFSDIVAFMAAHGFSVFDIVSGSNVHGKLAQIDLVFVPTDSPFRR